tara:strand:- start:1149 stop:1811 length:663 start_codon:yes stop_codon:yes gene_type:complete
MFNKIVRGKNRDGNDYAYIITKIIRPEMTDEFQEFIDELNSVQFIKDCGGIYLSDMGLINQRTGVPLRNDGVTNVEMIEGNVYKLWDKEFGSISLYPKDNGVELFRLEIYNQGKGYGSKMLQLFNHISCKLDVPMTLSPGAPGDREQYKNDGDQGKRISFYERNGFCKTDNHFMAPRMSNQCLVDQYYNDEIELPNVDLTEIINSKVIEGAVKWIQENVQ